MVKWRKKMCMWIQHIRFSDTESNKDIDTVRNRNKENGETDTVCSNGTSDSTVYLVINIFFSDKLQINTSLE